eukprot:COSAG02_NODE_37142_length_446_cov_0.550432_1_plen_103_part_10
MPCTPSEPQDFLDCDTVNHVVEWIALLQSPRQSGVTRKVRRRKRSVAVVKPNLDDEALRRHILQTPLGGNLPIKQHLAVPADALAAAMRLAHWHDGALGAVSN